MSFEHPSEDLEEKQDIWQKKMEEVEAVVDRLGEPIDENIKEAVVALNLLGVRTSASCEGHLDKERASPWIDVEADTEELEKAMDEEVKSESDRATIRDQIRVKNLEERRKILSLLGEFYGSRKTAFEDQLTVMGYGLGTSRIESQGAEMQKIEPVEVRAAKLKDYQAEMKHFTEFLKNKYFKS